MMLQFPNCVAIFTRCHVHVVNTQVVVYKLQLFVSAFSMLQSTYCRCNCCNLQVDISLVAIACFNFIDGMFCLQFKCYYIYIATHPLHLKIHTVYSHQTLNKTCASLCIPNSTTTALYSTVEPSGFPQSNKTLGTRQGVQKHSLTLNKIFSIHICQYITDILLHLNGGSVLLFQTVSGPAVWYWKFHNV